MSKGGARGRDRRFRARRVGAKRRSAEGGGSGEGRRSPSSVWGSGAMPSENLKKINVEIAYFSAFLQAVMVSSAVAQGRIRQ